MNLNLSPNFNLNLNSNLKIARLGLKVASHYQKVNWLLILSIEPAIDEYRNLHVLEMQFSQLKIKLTRMEFG